MWEVDNSTPFAVGHSWVRDRNGAETWIVAVRGTFDIQPDGSTVPSKTQVPVCDTPAYGGDPSKSSLLNDTDLTLTKTGTDVVMRGHAYAPNGEPRRSVDVSIRVGAISKQVRVFGDRFWVRGASGMTLSQARPFVQIPLIWERAYGGADPKNTDPNQPAWSAQNPAGVGFANSEANLENRQAPNLEDPTALITSWKDRPKPAGFGPIAYHWSPRVDFCGTYDAAWRKTRFPLVPTDFDDRFYQCAPTDQQVRNFLRGGEACELVNVSPKGPIRFRLPKVVVGFQTHFYTGAHADHNGRLHTVILDPDHHRVMLVWQSALPAHAKVLKLERTNVFEKDQV
jgi:hypothetical protein